MPITQDRMISLIQAAEDLYYCWKSLRDQYQAIAPGAPVPTPEPETLMSVAREQGHFKSNASRNDIKKRQMARRRAEAKGEPKAELHVKDMAPKRQVLDHIQAQRQEQGLEPEAKIEIEVDPQAATPHKLEDGIF